MKKIRLELDTLRILRKRERWQLYFIVYTTHRDDASKTLVRIVPGDYNITLKPASGNQYHFKPTGAGADGLTIFQDVMPPAGHAEVRLCMMQSRGALKDIAARVSDLIGDLGLPELLPVHVARLKWYLAGKGIDAITSMLEKTKDRNMGFLSMDEEFGEEFTLNTRQTRRNTLSSGLAQITWSWKVTD